MGGGGSFGGGGATTVTGGPVASASGGEAASSTEGGASGTHTGASISDGGTPATFYGGGAGAGPSGSTTTIKGGAGLTVSKSFSSDALFRSDHAGYGGGGAALRSPTVGTPGCGGNAPGSDPADTSSPCHQREHGRRRRRKPDGRRRRRRFGRGGCVPLVRSDLYPDFRGRRPRYRGLLPGGRAGIRTDATARPDRYRLGVQGLVHRSCADDASRLLGPSHRADDVLRKWDPVLATTGGGPNPAELPIAIGTLAIGAGLLGTVLYRRRRTAY